MQEAKDKKKSAGPAMESRTSQEALDQLGYSGAATTIGNILLTKPSESDWEFII